MQNTNSDFKTLYPGVYEKEEREALKKYFENAERINNRAELDLDKLVQGTLPEDTPGIGPVVPVTEAIVRYCNGKYEQENPLYYDNDYAQAHGYKDILAYFCFGAHDDTYTIPYPPEVRDKLLVSQISHSISNLAPVYPGDTLYMVFDHVDVVEGTPAEGSTYRTFHSSIKGSVYNQDKVKVNEVEFTTTESIEIYKDKSMSTGTSFADVWVAPDWLSRPAHQYTDADYEEIKKIWREEYLRGDEKLYWEDVNVGDRPARTADGPIVESVLPTAPYGQGAGGSRTLKKEVLDEEIFKTMIRTKEGIYVLPNKADYVPRLPEGLEVIMAIDDGRRSGGEEEEGAVDTRDIHSSGDEQRAPLINFFNRDTAIHHINNWMGDYGTIRNIKWSIMSPETHAVYGFTVPNSPFYHHYVNQVPGMEDRIMDSHGLTTDMAIVNSYVQKKYIENNRHMVRLLWWIEDIEGHIYSDGSADVELPSKQESLA